jgi:hypothetical protein
MAKNIRRPRDQTFRKTDLVRALRAALAAGLPVERVEVDPHTGRISVIVGKPGAAPADIDDLDAWLAGREKHAH